MCRGPPPQWHLDDFAVALAFNCFVTATGRLGRRVPDSRASHRQEHVRAEHLSLLNRLSLLFAPLRDVRCAVSGLACFVLDKLFAAVW
jgi:hypothetical protein